MSPGICAAVDEVMSIGLGLAGAEEVLTWVEGDDREVLDNWYKDMLNKDVSVMVLSPECGKALEGPLFIKRARGRMLPVVVILPSEEEDSRARELIKRAIGLDPSNKEGMGGVK